MTTDASAWQSYESAAKVCSDLENIHIHINLIIYLFTIALHTLTTMCLQLSDQHNANCAEVKR